MTTDVDLLVQVDDAPLVASDGPGPVVIIGAGPAGLTAAYHLTRSGATSTVLEADSVVGGISRTVERAGWRFDIGGHRFFTKVQAVQDVWHEILTPNEFVVRPRLSRIFYNGQFFDYPLRAGNALKGLGVKEAMLCVGSYAYARVRPPKDQTTFEGWTASRFGRRLYRIFFKTYTEKVWGVPADEIQADWAAQRIKDLSLAKAAIHALMPSREKSTVTSLIEQFHYPVLGPGMMWERLADIVTERGVKVLLETPVAAIEHADGQATAVLTSVDGASTRYDADHVISSMPLGHLVSSMRPSPPPEVLEAAASLRYRDFLTVALVVPADKAFPDNWIYVHAPDVRLGRIQNFGAWSPAMVKDGWTCLGLEYFVFEGDEMWESADDDLIALGKEELGKLGLVDPAVVAAGYVVRMPKAYPLYDDTYKGNVEIMRSWIEEHTPNVYPVGRNGMHRYNNQDHSMYTAMLSVDNILGADHDIWEVNVDAEYHEESHAADGQLDAD